MFGGGFELIPLKKGGLRGLLLCVLRVLRGKLFILQYYPCKSAFPYFKNHVGFYFNVQSGIVDGIIVYAYPTLLNQSARLAVGICKAAQDNKPCNPYLAVGQFAPGYLNIWDVVWKHMFFENTVKLSRGCFSILVGMIPSNDSLS